MISANTDPPRIDPAPPVFSERLNGVPPLMLLPWLSLGTAAVVVVLELDVCSGATSVDEGCTVDESVGAGKLKISVFVGVAVGVAVGLELVWESAVLVVCTLWLVVGVATLALLVVAAWLDFSVVGATFADGHIAARIPPFMTMPSNDLGSASTVEHTRSTLCATASSALAHPAEQPFLKSDVVHVGIWL
jgi:hypothetical protein